MSQKTVYVVDDDAAVRRSVAKLARVLGHEVRTFESAESFLAASEKGASGCLLLDMRMPGMSGLDLLSELARRRSSLAVIVMSGHMDADTLRKPALPIVGVLEKPFSIDALRRLLRGQAEHAGIADV
jgi:two-component system, LuxR family, response regulator FixJ